VKHREPSCKKETEERCPWRKKKQGVGSSFRPPDFHYTEKEGTSASLTVVRFLRKSDEKIAGNPIVRTEDKNGPRGKK